MGLWTGRGREGVGDGGRGGGEGDEEGPAALGYRLFLVLKISVMYVVVSFFSYPGLVYLYFDCILLCYEVGISFKLSSKKNKKERNK